MTGVRCLAGLILEAGIDPQAGGGDPHDTRAVEPWLLVVVADNSHSTAMLVHEIMDRAQLSSTHDLAMLDFDWNQSERAFQYQVLFSPVGGAVVGVLARNASGCQAPKDLLNDHALPGNDPSGGARAARRDH